MSSFKLVKLGTLFKYLCARDKIIAEDIDVKCVIVEETSPNEPL